MTARPDDDVMTLTVETVVQGTGCLPVLEDGQPLGMVTREHLLRYIQTRVELGE